jgi:hypothetical protein
MLGLWDDRREVKATNVHLSLEQKRRILRGLALHLFLGEQDELDEPAIFEWLAQFLQTMGVSFSAEEVLTVLRERSGLIVGPGIYNFAHKSSAEYLVAEAVLQGDQRDTSGSRIDRFSLFEHRLDDRWNTVVFLWAGLAPIADVEAFIEECIKTDLWALAFGVFEDQYERIPVEIRQRFLRKAISTELELSWNIQNESGGRSYWIIPHYKSISDNLRRNPEKGYRLEIPWYRLRGLTRTKTFRDIIFSAVGDGTLG